MADNDMLGVRSGRDADEACSFGGCMRSSAFGWPLLVPVGHRVFHGNSQKEACSLTFDQREHELRDRVMHA